MNEIHLEDFEKDILGAAADPVADRQRRMASEEAYASAPMTSETESESTTGSETVEIIGAVPAEQNGSFQMAVVFILSMIVGLLVFGSLSRRWHS